MIKIPENVADLVTYEHGKRFEVIKEKFRPEEIAKLSSNENTNGASPKALAAMQEAIKDSHWYPDPACLDLRRKIAAKFGVGEENIVVGNGSEGLISNICRAFFEPGDELLTSINSFVAVYITARAANIPCIKVPMKEGYKLDLDAILAAVTPKTKAIYLANPNNPTGTMFAAPEFAEFMSEISRDILVILDEAYYEFARYLSPDYPNVSFLDYDNIINLRTFSKAYGLAGIRIGYGVANEPIINALLKVKLVFEPSVIAQAAGGGAIEDEEFLQRAVENNKQGLDYFHREFSDLGLPCFESFANFVMIEFPDSERAMEISSKLLEHGVIVRPLKSFGLPHCIRITVGQPWENELCVRAMREIL